MRYTRVSFLSHAHRERDNPSHALHTIVLGCTLVCPAESYAHT